VSHKLFDMRMADGSRHFGGLPETYDAACPEWERIRDAVPRLAGATLTGYVTDEVTEAWIDLSFGGHAFSLNNQQGQWWLFVADPACPDETLLAVLEHFEATLLPSVALARSFGAIAPGSFRAIVSEGDARVTHRDFDDLATAITYANDAASETEEGPILAWVVDAELRVVHRGVHY